MKVYALESESSEFKKLLDDLSQYIDIDLFDSVDTFLDYDFDQCDAVLLDYDTGARKVDKLLKKVKKIDPNILFFLSSTELDAKKLSKHQASKLGAHIYFHPPMKKEIIELLIEPYITSSDSRGPDESQLVEIVKSHLVSKKISPGVKNFSDSVDKVFSTVFTEDNLDTMKFQRSNSLPVKAVVEDSGWEESEELSLGAIEEFSINLDDDDDEVKFPDEEDLTLPDAKLPEEFFLDSDDDVGKRTEKNTADTHLNATAIESGIDLSEFRVDLGEVVESDGTETTQLENPDLYGNEDKSVSLDLSDDDMALDLGEGSELSLGEDDDIALDLGDGSELSLGEDDDMALDLGEGSELSLGEDDDMALDLGEGSELSLGEDNDIALDLGDGSELSLGEDDDIALDLGEGSELSLGEDDDIALDLGDGSELSLGEDDDMALDLGDGSELSLGENDDIALDLGDGSELSLGEANSDSFHLPDLDDAAALNLDNLISNSEKKEKSDIIERDTIFAKRKEKFDEITASSIPVNENIKPLGSASTSEPNQESKSLKIKEPTEENFALHEADKEEFTAIGLMIDSEKEDFDPTADMAEAESEENEVESLDLDPSELQLEVENNEEIDDFNLSDDTNESLEILNDREQSEVSIQDDATMMRINPLTSIDISEEVGSEERENYLEEQSVVQKTDEEIIKLNEKIRLMGEEKIDFLAKISNLENQIINNPKIDTKAQLMLEDKQIELDMTKKKYQKKLQDVELKLDLNQDKTELLLKQNKNLGEKIESLSRANKIDYNKVRARERELEEKLDMMRKDAEIQIRNRDQKILELKRRIDVLEFDIESTQTKERKSLEKQSSVEDKMNRVIQTLRGAIGDLEEDEQISNYLNQEK